MKLNKKSKSNLRRKLVAYTLHCATHPTNLILTVENLDPHGSFRLTRSTISYGISIESPVIPKHTHGRYIIGQID